MTQIMPLEVVDAYFRALAARDFQRVRQLLADRGFTSHSPISEFSDADAYITDIARVGPILEAIERRKTFVDGADVCAIVAYVTRMDRRQVSSVVHWMRVDAGKIVSVETFFDARRYAAMFEVD